jgi:hypothetical protein
MKSLRIINRTLFSSVNPFLWWKSPPEFSLFDPYHISKHWLDEWVCTSDKGYGGSSIAELFIESIDSESEHIKFLRFQGSMNMTQQIAKNLGVAGGFCGFRGTLDCQEVLDNYQGFEIICRSGIDTNIVLNMTLENRTQEDVYQVEITISTSF